MSTCGTSQCSGSGSINSGQEVCSFSELYEYMTPELPSCPPAMLLQSLRRISRRFCEDTEAWIENVEPINIKKGVQRYEMDIYHCARIKRIKRVEYKTQEQVDNSLDGGLLSHWQYQVEMPFDLILNFAPLEDVKKGLLVKAVLYPEFKSDSISREFLNEWYEGIVAGAMASLLKMPNKRWTDIQQAQIYATEYRKWWNLATQERFRQHKDADMSLSA